MKDLLSTINNWVDENKPFATATVIQTWGSSPRPVGSTMLVSQDMEMAGSVSGGCVEGAVVKAALPLIENGICQRLAYGVTDEDAWEVGLSCGGKMQVFAERFMAFDKRPEEQAAWKQLKKCLENNEPCVLLTKVIDGVGGHSVILPDGNLIGQPISERLKSESLRAYKERKNQVIEDGNYFVKVFPRKSKMLIIGAAHITVDLVKLAGMFGFETVVIDPRGVFAKKNTVPISARSID